MSWNEWKEKHEHLALFIVTPIVVPLLALVILAKWYNRLAVMFGWKLWKLL